MPDRPRELRIGTRGSQLALWQANTVAARIAGAGGPPCRIITIKTTGDRLQDAPLSEVGGKRLFVKEIEDALLRHDIDLAVHSSKDMPAILPDGLTIGAVLPREDPLDAIVLPSTVRLKADTTYEADHTHEADTTREVDTKPEVATKPEADTTHDAGTTDDPTYVVSGFSRTVAPVSGVSRTFATIADIATVLGRSPVIGTGSVRRIAQLTRLLPGARFEPIRGNLDTRLRKLDEGQYDALVLAAAGLRRLGFASRISLPLPSAACVPAPGQGIVAIEIREGDEYIREVVARIDDSAAAAALNAERALVVALGGGCQTPIGALASPVLDDGLELVAAVVSLDGGRVVRRQARGRRADAAALGASVAAGLLEDGAGQILAEAQR